MIEFSRELIISLVGNVVMLYAVIRLFIARRYYKRSYDLMTENILKVRDNLVGSNKKNS